MSVTQAAASSDCVLSHSASAIFQSDFSGSTAPVVSSRLTSLPSEVLERIALFAALGSPPSYSQSTLLNFLLTCHAIHRTLSPSNNVTLYAQIFLNVFDSSALYRRLAPYVPSSSVLCDQLLIRFLALHRTRALASRAKYPLHDLPSPHSSSITHLDDDLWTLLIILLEDDGLNVPLIQAHDVEAFLISFWSHGARNTTDDTAPSPTSSARARLQEAVGWIVHDALNDEQGPNTPVDHLDAMLADLFATVNANSSSNNSTSQAGYSLRAWAPDTTRNALAMWCLWLLLRADEHDSALSSVLKIHALGAHKYALARPSWTLFTTSNHPSGISSGPTTTQLHRSYLGHPSLSLSPTPLAAPAILSFFAVANAPRFNPPSTSFFGTPEHGLNVPMIDASDPLAPALPSASRSRIQFPIIASHHNPTLGPRQDALGTRFMAQSDDVGDHRTGGSSGYTTSTHSTASYALPVDSSRNGSGSSNSDMDDGSLRHPRSTDWDAEWDRMVRLGTFWLGNLREEADRDASSYDRVGRYSDTHMDMDDRLEMQMGEANLAGSDDRGGRSHLHRADRDDRVVDDITGTEGDDDLQNAATSSRMHATSSSSPPTIIPNATSAPSAVDRNLIRGRAADEYGAGNSMINSARNSKVGVGVTGALGRAEVQVSKLDLGTLAGVWEGMFMYTEFHTYAALLMGGPPAYLARPDVMQHRQTWRLREHHLISSLSSDPTAEEELLDGSDALHAYVPRDAQVREDRGAGLLNVTHGGKEWVYKTFTAENSQTSAPGPRIDDEHEESSVVRDVLITGEGHSAWGRFTLLGRLRPLDGLVCVLKQYASGDRGEWLYRAYLVGGTGPSANLAGRWRETRTEVELDGYEGGFVLSRRG